MYYDDFFKRIQKEAIPSSILFFGDSENVLAEGFQTLKMKFRNKYPDGEIKLFECKGRVTGNLRRGNTTDESFAGTANELADTLASAQTAGLFTRTQLVVLKNAGKMFSGNSEIVLQLLRNYFANPNPDSHLVFLAPGAKKTSKVVAAFERLGWVVQCSEIPDWKILGWIGIQAGEKGLNLSEEGSRLLIEKIGSDVTLLKQALEQLLIYIYPRKNASVQDVQALPVPGIESEIFSFLDAFGSRKTHDSLCILSKMGEKIDSGVVMMIYQRVREMLAIAIQKSRGIAQTQITEKIGLHPFRFKKLWDQSSRYTTEELKFAMKNLIQLQAGVVTGRIGKNLLSILLERLILTSNEKQ